MGLKWNHKAAARLGGSYFETIHRCVLLILWAEAARFSASKALVINDQTDLRFQIVPGNQLHDILQEILVFVGYLVAAR